MSPAPEVKSLPDNLWTLITNAIEWLRPCVVRYLIPLTLGILVFALCLVVIWGYQQSMDHEFVFFTGESNTHSSRMAHDIKEQLEKTSRIPLTPFKIRIEE